MITLILILLSSSLSWATVTVQDVSGASKWNLVSNNVEIFGGFAGDEDANCILNADGTCNNCLSIASTGTLTACNETRAMLNSGLTISIKSDSITGSGPIIMAASDSTSNQIGLDGDTVSKDVTGSVTVPWTTICTTLLSSGAGSSCATSLNPYGSFTLRVGIDTNNDNNIDSDEDYTDITLRT